MKAIIGKKVGMSQIFDENGHVIPVTVIEAVPAWSCRRRLPKRKAMRRSSWALRTSLSVSSPSPRRATWTRPACSQEVPAGVRPGECRRAERGRHREADAFQAGDFVDVTGISKGHGYQGVIKRHGAHRLKETHGSGPVARQIGSLGATSHMSKIIKAPSAPATWAWEQGGLSRT